MTRALPDLFYLSGLIVAFGLVFMARGLVDFINWCIHKVIGGIPLIGSLITLAVDDVLQPLSNALGVAEAKIDLEMGRSFHRLARLVTFMAELLIALPILLYEVLRLLYEKTLGDQVTSQTATHAVARANVVGHDVAQRSQGADTANAAALAAVAALGTRVGALESSIADTLDPEIAGLRERTRAVEDGFQRAWDLIKAHEEALGIGAVTSAVAVALEALDSSWIRCETNKLLGRKLCGSNFSLLKALLEGTLGALSIVELCNLSKLLVKVADSGPVQDTLTLVTKGLSDLFKCQGVSRAKPYKLTAAALAPSQGFAELTPPSV